MRDFLTTVMAVVLGVLITIGLVQYVAPLMEDATGVQITKAAP